jgi:hypothetical protein
MEGLPVRLPNARVPFALRGRLDTGFELLVASDDCPVSLFNAMPGNSAGESSGHLRRHWFCFFKPHFNWAYSGSLPPLENPITSPPLGHAEKTVGNPEGGRFRLHPGGGLEFAWRAYSTKGMRSRVQERLDRQRLDLHRAIVAGDPTSIATALAPVLLECEGYST